MAVTTRYEQLVKEALLGCRGSGPVAEPTCPALPFEQRVALRDCGRTDPGSIDDYIARCAGYSGLARALELGAEAVIAKLRLSGLRGRGGAGYPAAQKWQLCRDAQGDEKFAVCDAIDADPCARTARLLMGSDPHAVLEGLLIGAYAVGAAECLICINAEYDGEIVTVEAALDQMRRRGLLGNEILDTGFCCDIRLAAIPGSLVAGEETALIRALEDKQPLPYLRLDHPAVKGLSGKPTLMNNVETLATVSAVFQTGRAATGRDPDDAGGRAGDEVTAPLATKIVTICGDVSSEVTVEIPLGMTIAALLEATQGAPPEELGIKAVQFGGPTGAFFAGASLDTPIAFEDLAAGGSIMGSATIRVFGECRDDSPGICAVELARDALSYLQGQSCGKCAACREGTHQLAGMLDDLAEFQAKPGDMALMLELCGALETGSICGLGKTASLPLRSLLDLFAGDFQAHIDAKRCPAKEQG